MSAVDKLASLVPTRTTRTTRIACDCWRWTEYDLIDFVERGDQICEAAEKLHPEVTIFDVRCPD